MKAKIRSASHVFVRVYQWWFVLVQTLSLVSETHNTASIFRSSHQQEGIKPPLHMGSTNSQRPINRSRVLQLCTCVNARMHKQDQKNERNAVKCINQRTIYLHMQYIRYPYVSQWVSKKKMMHEAINIHKHHFFNMSRRGLSRKVWEKDDRGVNDGAQVGNRSTQLRLRLCRKTYFSRILTFYWPFRPHVSWELFWHISDVRG